MRRYLVAQVALLGGLGALYLVAQRTQFIGQEVDLLLLAINDPVEFLDQILGVTDLDFKFGDAGFHVCSLWIVGLVARAIGWAGR